MTFLRMTFLIGEAYQKLKFACNEESTHSPKYTNFLDLLYIYQDTKLIAPNISCSLAAASQGKI